MKAAGRLISDAAASASMVRQWLGQDAERAATTVIWGVYSEAEALNELQEMGRILDIMSKRLDCSTDHVAREMFYDALERQEYEHGRSFRLMVDAALALLLQGGDKTTAALATAAIAKSRSILPPPNVVYSAIEVAMRKARFTSGVTR